MRHEGAQSSLAQLQQEQLLGCKQGSGVLSLDPRTLMGVLVTVSILAFMDKSLYVEFALVCVIGLLQVLCGYVRMAIGFVVVYGLLMFMLHVVLPGFGGIAATMFTISFTFARKIYLCLMAGSLLVSDASVHRISVALAKLHIPQSILIPLMVTFRSFPTLKEEASHIRDAMSLRVIPTTSKIECFVVPLVMSAASTADELSRAATCRGIENPTPSTDTERLSMRAVDWVVLTLFSLMVIAVAFFGGVT